MDREMALELRSVIASGSLEHVNQKKLDNSERNFPLNMQSCTGTMCADGVRFGPKLIRMREELQTENVHALTSHGGILECVPYSPVLYSAGWTNSEIADFINRKLHEIEDARSLLKKGELHIASHHFPCGAATRARLATHEQFQLYYASLKFTMEQLHYHPSQFLCVTHIDWGNLAEEFNEGERFAMYVFKKTAWCRYASDVGITPHLDVETFNTTRLADIVPREHRFAVDSYFIPAPHEKGCCDQPEGASRAFPCVADIYATRP